MNSAEYRLKERAATFRLYVLFTAIVWAATAYAGMSLVRSGNNVAPLWLPNALLFATAIKVKPREARHYLGACFLVSVGLGFILGKGAALSVGLSIANLAEVAVAIGILRRSVRSKFDINTIPIGLLLAICVIAPVSSAAIANVVFTAQGNGMSSAALIRWVLADGLGLMIGTPITMLAIDAYRSLRRPSMAELLSWATFVVAVTVAATAVFAQSRFPFLFLACPITLYAAFKRGIAGTAIATAVISIVAMIATFLGSGPLMLIHGDMGTRILSLQLFLGTCFCMGMPVARTLSAQAAVRAQLQENQDFTASIIDNIHEVIFRTDATGHWIFLNQAWETLTGYTVKESLGWSTTKLLHPDDFVTTLETYPLIANGGVEHATLSQRFYDRSGECRHIEVSVRRLVDVFGQYCGVIGNIRDVTGMVLQQRAVAESEARFRDLAEAAPVGIFRADPKGNLTFINRTWAKKLGLGVTAMLGRGWTAALANTEPFEGNGARAAFKKCEETRTIVIRFRGSDGADLWAEAVFAGRCTPDGAITEYVGVLIDITEQRLATEKLLDSERRYQTLTDLAPAGIFRSDRNGTMTYANASWLAITGLGSDEWQSEGWGNALHPDDREQVFDDWATAVAEGRDYRGDFRWVHPDGKIAWVDVLARPALDEQGEIGGFVGVVMDITERRAVERVLAEREAQLALLAHNATDAVFRLSLEGRCIYASPSAQDVLGVTAESLVNASMLDRFHPEDDGLVRQAFAALASGSTERRVVAYRSRMIGSGETYRWLEANCGLVRDPMTGDQLEIIASIRDVSINKALEAQLVMARATAETAATAKSAFLANMSHEIRTPMNGVLGFTELLLGTGLDDTQRTYVSLLADSGRAMMRLLNDILDVSKIESRRMDVCNEPFDVLHVIRNGVQLMVPVAHSKGITLELELDPAISRSVRGDALRVKQVLLNLIGNAAKFTQKGMIKVIARLVDHEGESNLLIEVADTGIGIPADKLTTIFEKFAQADATIARGYGGTGLGLAISRELALLMGGLLAVQSEVGIGTTFSFSLPYADAAEELPTRSGPQFVDAAAEPPAPVTISGNRRVLIAEDHDINQALITAMARSAGLDPYIAADGAEAIEMIVRTSEEGRPFAMAFMDMQMPGIDGLEATRRIRAHGISPAQLPIVALTANAQPDDVRACIDAGMQAHLSKPVRVRDLSGMVARMLPGQLVEAQEQPRHAEIDPLTRLKADYEKRREDLMDTLSELAGREGISPSDLTTVLDQLHKLAGTAGFFDQSPLGDAASSLEGILRACPEQERSTELQAGLVRLRHAA